MSSTAGSAQPLPFLRRRERRNLERPPIILLYVLISEDAVSMQHAPVELSCVIL